MYVHDCQHNLQNSTNVKQNHTNLNLSGLLVHFGLQKLSYKCQKKRKKKLSVATGNLVSVSHVKWCHFQHFCFLSGLCLGVSASQALSTGVCLRLSIFKCDEMQDRFA